MSTETMKTICWIVTSLEGLVESNHRFRCIYVDPPWPFRNTQTRAAAARHYNVLSLKEIGTLPIDQLLQDNAHFYLWCPTTFLEEALALLRTWSLTYKSMIIWAKPQLGLGNYIRSCHEILLFAVKGRLPVNSRKERSVVEHSRCGHSVKPEVFRDMIERLSPGPRLELFARRLVPGWFVWGDQLPAAQQDRYVQAEVIPSAEN